MEDDPQREQTTPEPNMLGQIGTPDDEAQGP